MPQNNGALIRTKLHRPRVAGDLVPRPRLLEYLARHQMRPLTLISASAGYGKTSLVSSWLDTADRPSAWVSLDEYDDDFATFLDYLIAAIQTLYPESLSETQILAEAPELPPLRVLAATLINELDQIETSFSLVLDDYHNINTAAIHELLNEVLRHPPRPLHLILIARRDPPLALVTLRSRSQMSEIRPGELRFTTAETVEFLQSMLQKPVEESAAASLTERTEGWITGMRLAVLSLRNRDDLDRLLANLPKHSHYVTDYLVNEVLALQPVAMLDNLRATSILDRFCTPLCDAVFGPDVSSEEFGGRGQIFMDWLITANPFVAPLDDQREWYRYQHLFQDLLQRQLVRERGPAEVAVYHRRASDWFAEHGFLDEALRHALDAGDTSAAVQLVAQHRHELMNQEEWLRLERWIKRFPPEVVAQAPDLLMTKAWVAYYLWYDLGTVLTTIDSVEDRLRTGAVDPAKASQILAEIAVIRSHFAYWFADGETAVRLAQQALESTPVEHECVYASALIGKSGGLQQIGEADSAEEIALDFQKSGDFKYQSSSARLLFGLCIVYWATGELGDLQQAATRLLKLSEDHSMVWSSSFARYYLGLAHYERNELASAVAYLSPLVENRYRYPMVNVGHSVFPLALAHQEQGEPDKAAVVLETISDLALERQNPLFIGLVKTAQVELHLRFGQVAEVIDWARHFETTTLNAAQRYYVPELVYVHALLAEATPESLANAGDVLTELQDHFSAINANCVMIKVLALQAMLADRQDNEPKALEKLQASVLLAEPGRWIRCFVDMGPRIVPLLHELRRQDVAPGYVDEILSATATHAHSDSERLSVPQSENDALIEPLTGRELEVLTLLAQQLSNKEIAAELVVTSGTVRQHLYNIYQKLQVESRLQAVATAINLGILPPLA